MTGCRGANAIVHWAILRRNTVRQDRHREAKTLMNSLELARSPWRQPSVTIDKVQCQAHESINDFDFTELGAVEVGDWPGIHRLQALDVNVCVYAAICLEDHVPEQIRFESALVQLEIRLERVGILLPDEA
jgi:pantothenate synthetase